MHRGAGYDEMSGIAFQHSSGDKVWQAIGLMQEELLAEENAKMEANMPAPVHDFCVGSGRGMFQGFVGKLRG